MRSFNVYERNDGMYKAVKNGWSWPAFFFGSIWALCMQLWLIGLLLLPVELLLQMIISVTQKTQNNNTIHTIAGAITISALLIRILFGSFGNSWKRKKLERLGYTVNTVLEARSKEDAVSLALSRSRHSGIYSARTTDTSAQQIASTTEGQHTPMGSKLARLTKWYAKLPNKKRFIIFGIAMLLSAAGPPGWILIAPWLVPLMIFLEYHRP